MAPIALCQFSSQAYYYTSSQDQALHVTLTLTLTLTKKNISVVTITLYFLRNKAQSNCQQSICKSPQTRLNPLDTGVGVSLLSLWEWRNLVVNFLFRYKSEKPGSKPLCHFMYKWIGYEAERTYWSKWQGFFLQKSVDQSNSSKFNAKYEVLSLCNYWQNSLLFEHWHINVHSLS